MKSKKISSIKSLSLFIQKTKQKTKKQKQNKTKQKTI